MDIISFGLGIGSVVFITSVVITVLSFVKLEKLNKRIKEIEVYINTSIECIYSSINTNSELDNRRIDGEIDRTNRVVDDIYRTMDSRLYKLEVKLNDSNKGNKLIKG